MKHKIFLLILGGGFLLALHADKAAKFMALGDCDAHEVWEWDQAIREEWCEPGYSWEEACETANGITADCNLNWLPGGKHEYKVNLYNTGWRKSNGNIRFVRKFDATSQTMAEDFENVRTWTLVEYESLAVELEPQLKELLSTAAEHMGSLPFGQAAWADDAPDPGPIYETVVQLDDSVHTAPDSTQELISTMAAELNAYVDFATSEVRTADVEGTVIGKTVRMINHVTGVNSGFQTRLIIDNQGTATRDYTLRAYNSQGNMVEEVSGTLDGHQTLNQKHDELFSVADVSHFVVAEGDGLEVTAEYSSTQFHCPVYVNEDQHYEKRWRLFAGDWNVMWDGLAVVNMGYGRADITVKHFDKDGALLDSRQVESLSNLAPMGKGLAVFNDLGFQAVEGSQFQIVANQPVMITALRGTKSATQPLLWQNLIRAD